MNSLIGKRILICGKGGSGKSTITTMLAKVLENKGYKVVLIDGDASNPYGLLHLVSGSKRIPEPLINYFGGRVHVTCPVDDPSPLTRVEDRYAITQRPIDLKEIPKRYYLREGNIILFQVGKTENINEGCDGPMSKVTRDFIIKGDFVTIIDTEAGIEHFGRGIEDHVDGVIIVVNPSIESLNLVKKINSFCSSLNIENVWAILNLMTTKKLGRTLSETLAKSGINILDVVHYDSEISLNGLLGNAISTSKSLEALSNINDHLFVEVTVKH